MTWSSTRSRRMSATFRTTIRSKLPLQEQEQEPRHPLADARAAQLLHELSRRMPAQYALTTSYADRLEHARLLAETALGAKPQADAVRLAWRLEEGSHATLWLVFPDRRGSLGLITSLLSELGVNIGKVSAFSSTDGFAVDTFTVDRCVSELEGDAPESTEGLMGLLTRFLFE